MLVARAFACLPKSLRAAACPNQSHALPADTIRCTCADCRLLVAFLRDPIKTSMELRRGRQQRRHIHEQLNFRSDVSHISCGEVLPIVKVPRGRSSSEMMQEVCFDLIPPFLQTLLDQSLEDAAQPGETLKELLEMPATCSWVLANLPAASAREGQT